MEYESPGLNLDICHSLLPASGEGSDEMKVTFASYVSVTITFVAFASPLFSTVIV